jgi:hypothetical protein
MPVKRHGAGAKVPHERTAVRAQHAADLGQARLRVGPVVHRQCAHHQIERSIGERHRGHVADDERGSALVVVLRTVGVGSGSRDHGRIEVESGHVESVPASQPDRQAAGPRPTSNTRAPSGETAAISAAMRSNSDPSKLLLRAIAHGQGVEEIARECGVTIEMARFRVNTTGVVRQTARAKARRVQ